MIFLRRKKGQGSLEYGVFFAFSLMVGLIIITLTGKFSNYGLEGRIEESKGYWYAKKPLAIEDIIYYSNGNLSLLLRSKEVNPIRVYNITTKQGVIQVNALVSSNHPLSINGSGFPICNASNLEDVKLENIVIYYKKPEAANAGMLSESGKLPLRTYCIEAPSISGGDDGGGGGGGGGCAGGTILYSLILLYYLLGV